jgi:hypothetical protein
MIIYYNDKIYHGLHGLLTNDALLLAVARRLNCTTIGIYRLCPLGHREVIVPIQTKQKKNV